MQIKVHLSGCAIAYENSGGKVKHSIPVNSRPQGSLYGQQRRKISDAVEWMRLYGQNKPIFFVATTPGKINISEHAKKIQSFTTNLRNSYGCKDYVWVRELTDSGLPHYHFVADMPYIRDPVRLSRYWSGLFDKTAQNSIRLGSAPYKGKRKFYVDSPEAARYISKYIGKDLDKVKATLEEQGLSRRSYRSFAISQTAALLSQPEVYEANFHFQEREAYNAKEQRVVVREFVARTFNSSTGEELDPTVYEWKRIEPHNIFFGFRM